MKIVCVKFHDDCLLRLDGEVSEIPPPWLYTNENPGIVFRSELLILAEV